MDLTRSNLDRLFQDWRIVSLSAFSEGAAPIAPQICQVETSNSELNIYDLMIQFPKFRRFRDTIELQNLGSAQHSIKNDEWDSTVQVKRADVERDHYGKYTTMFKMLGTAARKSPDVALAKLLAGSFEVADYTGLPFFSTNKKHLPTVANSRTFDNLMTEKPSAGSWEKAKLMLSTMADMGGDPMGLGSQMLVVCGMEWQSTFKKILKAETIAEVVADVGVAAVSNIFSGDADLLTTPYLTGDAWYVLDMSWPLRAFILQNEKSLTLTAQDRDTDDCVFEKKVNRYQGYYRGDVGYGLPQLAIGSTGEDDAL